MKLHEMITRPIVSLDVESTGPSVTVDRITQFGAVKVYPDGREVPWDTLINPGPEFQPPPSAEDEQEWVTIWRRAKLNAPVFADIADGLWHALHEVDVIGYNVKRFDIRILEAEFKRTGRDSPFAGAAMIDGFMLWAKAEPRRLEHAMAKYSVTQEGPLHNAACDARNTLAVVKTQLEILDVPQTMQEIHEWLWPKPEGAVDEGGKLQLRGEEVFLTFGKHNGTALSVVPKTYLSWMLAGDFDSDVKAAVRSAIDAR